MATLVRELSVVQFHLLQVGFGAEEQETQGDQEVSIAFFAAAVSQKLLEQKSRRPREGYGNVLNNDCATGTQE